MSNLKILTLFIGRTSWNDFQYWKVQEGDFRNWAGLTLEEISSLEPVELQAQLCPKLEEFQMEDKSFTLPGADTLHIVFVYLD